MNLFVANSTMPDHMKDSRTLMHELANQVRQAYSNIKHFDHSGWGSGERIAIGIHPNSACCNRFYISKDYKGVRFEADKSIRCTKQFADKLRELFPESSFRTKSWYQSDDVDVTLICIITRDNLNDVIKYVVRWLERDGFTLK